MKETRPNEILKTVEQMIWDAEVYKEEHNKPMRYRIDKVYADLGIFDWWNEYLSVSQLKQMEAFLKTAIARGFEGYAGFKVGASGCANGMWATVKASTDGYQPDGSCLYHSFSPDENYWSITFDGENWLGGYEEHSKLKDIDEFIWKHKCEQKKAEAQGKLLLYKVSAWRKSTGGWTPDIRIVADSEEKARAKALEMYGEDIHITFIGTDYNPVVIA